MTVASDKVWVIDGPFIQRTSQANGDLACLEVSVAKWSDGAMSQQDCVRLTLIGSNLQSAKAVQLKLTLKGFVILLFEEVGNDFLREALGVVNFEAIALGQPSNNRR
jgi:hypothetical protein